MVRNPQNTGVVVVEVSGAFPYISDLTFIFHPVGQGLFYTGKLHDFNFVYDCGTASNIDILHSCIKTYKEKTHHLIDMLVISHFHKDHISGIDELVRDITLDTVFLPYLSPVDKFFYFLDPSENNLGSNKQLLLDPIKYFLNDEKNVKRLFFVLPDDAEFKNVNSEVFRSIIERDFPGKNYGTLLNRQIFVIKNGEMPGWLSERLSQSSLSWDFRFANVKSLFPQKLKSYIFELIKKNNNGMEINDKNFSVQMIIKLIKDNELMKELRDCYHVLFRKVEINDSSLIMYHSPNAPSKSELLLNAAQSLNKSSTIDVDEVDSFIYGAQLLTGDLSFISHVEEVINKLRINPMNVVMIQLPHHGSFHNWDLRVMKYFQNTRLYPVSFGLKNGYNHPSNELINLLVKNGKQVLCVNEKNELRIYYCLFNPNKLDIECSFIFS